MKFVIAIAALGLLSSTSAHKINTKYLSGKPEDMNQEDFINKLGHQGVEHDDDVTDALEEQKEIKENQKDQAVKLEKAYKKLHRNDNWREKLGQKDAEKDEDWAS